MSGREFTRADDENAALVAVVNETMAAQYWRGSNPIGERVQVKGRWMQVVGIAKDSKYESVRETPKPFFYVPLRQNFSQWACIFEHRLARRRWPRRWCARCTRSIRTWHCMK